MNHDYIVCATKSKDAFQAIRGSLPLTDDARSRYANPDNDARGEWQSVAITAQAGHGTKSQFYTITTPGGRKIDPPSGNCWRFTQIRLDELIKDGRIWFGLDGNNVPRQKLFLAEQAEGLTPHTIWTSEEVGTTDSAKRALNDLFDGHSAYDTPKPVGLLLRILDIAGGKDSLVMDFFAGSGTIGEAVAAKNATDAGARRFVAVQLQEPLDPGNTDQREAAAFCKMIQRPLNISEITKERLRRCMKSYSVGDLGFRVYRLDTSNIRAWDPKRDDIAGSLDESVEHLKTDRTETDILFELLLKLGLELTELIEEKKIEGKTVYNIGAGTLMACLDAKIAAKEVEKLAFGIADWHKELAPAGETVVVFRDSAFADDVAKTNLTAILEQAREDRPMIIRSL